MRTKTRLDYLDVLKGIGILLVIFGHLMEPPEFPRILIYSFHMPLFLIVSGFFMKERDKFLPQLLKFFTKLYVPFLIFISADFLLSFIYYSIKLGKPVINILPLYLKALVGLSYGYDLPIWFLFSLFVIKSVIQLVLMIKNKSVRYVVLLTLMAAGIVYISIFQSFNVSNRHLPIYGIMPSMIFVILGYFLKRLIPVPMKIFTGKDRTSKLVLTLLMIVGAIVMVPLNMINGYVEIYGCQFGNPLLFLIGGLLGTFVFLTLSSLIAVNLPSISNRLVFFGTQSLKFQVLHYYLTDHLYPYLFIRFNCYELLETSLLVQVTLFIITVAILTPIVILSTHLIPRKKYLSPS